ncbi:MAG: hypothetical protein P4L79_07970 [Legionella sp.]|uniref:hypothetical protein n=1 Tax=Legionella sp. TaxID=459 RepID=UPI0028498B37|nr:hypothetical protein [Legionella sp.]
MMPKISNDFTQIFLFELINAGVAAGAAACAGANSDTILTAGLIGAGAATAGAVFLGCLGVVIDIMFVLSEKTPEQKEEKQDFSFTATGILAGSLIGSVGVGLGFFAVEAAPKVATAIKEYLVAP